MRDAEREIIEIGKKLGREEGIREGQAEGRCGMAKEAALSMHQKGYPEKEITDILKISSTTLEEWIQEAAAAAI